jgi:signal transduction histidine kinase
MGKTLCCYPERIQELFPQDVLLQQMGAQSYLGIPLWDSSGAPIGLIAVMGQRPMADRHLAQTILQIVAVRCAHELERRRAEEDRRKVEEQLARFQRLDSIGRLAGGVAHDMNNVLTAIMGVAHGLREEFTDDLSVTGELDLLLGAAANGRQLVKSLTEFARGGLRDAAPVDLNALLTQEAEIYRRTTLGKVAVVEDLEHPLPEVRGEASSLGNVLMNLCSNAVDAMPDGGTLRLRSRALRGGGVEISVQDSGAGMSPEVKARAMEPFFTTKARGKGTGLGLSLVYGAMNAHGGSVELESAIGEGTRVILRFPPMSQPRRAAAPEPLRAVDVRSLRVLLVDDEESVRTSTATLLRRAGHDVHAVTDGEAALALLSGGLAVDVALLDQNLPGLTGLETLRRVRATHAGLPAILVTGLVTPLLEESVASEPGLWLLPKPFAPAELRALLGAACQPSVASRGEAP